MGILDRIRSRRSFGSVQETVYHIINPIKETGISGFATEADAMGLYIILSGKRAQAALMAKQTEKNFQLDTGIDKIFKYYEECFGQRVLFSLKLDLPLFVFTTMYLESYNFRNSIMNADLILQKEVFDTIHTVCEHYHPYLVRFPDIISFDNMQEFSRFLRKKFRL